MSEIAERLKRLSPEKRRAFMERLNEAQRLALRNELTGTMSSEPTEDNIRNTNPEISALDRLAYKNLGNENSLPFLQEKYPDLDFAKDEDGEVIYRKGNTWHRMDPKGVTSAKEFFLDIADAGADLAKGAGAGMVGASAAFPAAVAAGPLGGFGGFVAGAGTAGAGLEGLRQGIGQYLGVIPEGGIEPGDLAFEGGIEAASSFFPGATMLPRKQLAKFAAKNINTDVVEAPFRELYRRLADYGSEFFGGPSQEAKQLGRKYIDRVVDVEKSAAADPLQREVRAIRQDTEKAVNTVKSDLWSKISREVDNAGGVNIRPLKDKIDTQIENLKEIRDTDGLNKNQEKLLNYYKGLKQEYFTRKKREVVEQPVTMMGKVIDVKRNTVERRVDLPDVIPANEAQKLKQDLYNEIDFNKDVSDIKGFNKNVAPILRDTANTVKTQIEVAAPNVKKLNREYEKIAGHGRGLQRAGIIPKGRKYSDMTQAERSGVQDDLDISFMDDKRAFGVMKDLSRASRYGGEKSLQSIDKAMSKIGKPSDLYDRARTIEAGKYWMKPKVANVENYGTPNMASVVRGRMLPYMLGGGALAGIGEYADSPWTRAIGLGLMGANTVFNAPAAHRQYLRLGKGIENTMRKGDGLPAMAGTRALYGNTISPWSLNLGGDEQ